MKQVHDGKWNVCQTSARFRAGEDFSEKSIRGSLRCAMLLMAAVATPLLHADAFESGAPAAEQALAQAPSDLDKDSEWSVQDVDTGIPTTYSFSPHGVPMRNRYGAEKDFALPSAAEIAFRKLALWTIVDLFAAIGLLLLVRVSRRGGHGSSWHRPMPGPVKFTVAWLFATCVTGGIALSASSSPHLAVALIGFLALKPLVALVIWKRRAWPQTLMLLAGLAALAGGFLERATIQSKSWNELAVTCVFNGVVHIFFYVLLACGSADYWRRGRWYYEDGDE